jgi:predicted nucleotidyltransferase
MPKFRVVDREIRLTKKVSDIDRFVLKVISIIDKYTEYVIVSGYVAIFFGRSRASEDVDLFIKELPIDRFRAMYDEFVANGFAWNIDNPDALYHDYLLHGLPIGVWVKDAPLLRIDMKLPKVMSQRLLFGDRVKVAFDSHELWMASIESTIAYKEEIARSDKDKLDAQHLRRVFEGLDAAKIENYKSMFNQEFHR